MVKILPVDEALSWICNDHWLLCSGLKSCKDKDDQNDEWHYVQEGKVFWPEWVAFCLFFSSWQLRKQSEMGLSFCQKLAWWELDLAWHGWT
jgi:hypothetical protein